MSTLNQLNDYYRSQACDKVHKTYKASRMVATDAFKLVDECYSKLQPRGKAFKRLMKLHRSSHKF